MAIFGYIGALIVEAIRHGVVTGATADRRRRQTIEHVRNHCIICGYGSPNSDVLIDDGDVRICVGTPTELFAPNQAIAR